MKKRELNGRRKEAKSQARTTSRPEKARLRYYQWLMGMMDGKEPTLDEVRALLINIRDKLRQPSLTKKPNKDKVPDD